MPLSFSHSARVTCGILLITIPTIQYGGYFLLRSLMGSDQSGYMENPLRQNFFRAGHAHAGVLVILSLICQIMADATSLTGGWNLLARFGVPLAAILMPMGFFFSVAPPRATRPNGAVNLIYLGAISLAAGVLTLGIGLITGS